MDTRTQEGSKVNYRCGGDITATTEKEIRTALKNLIAGGATDLTVDLADVRMIDSIGIGLLIATHNSLGKAGGVLTLVNASQDLMDLFLNMRLNQHFTITPA